MKHDKSFSPPNQQWSILFFISPLTSSYFLSSQRAAVLKYSERKHQILGSRDIASSGSTVCLINLKWCRTEGFLHFLCWIPLPEQMCQDSDTPLLCSSLSHTSFISFPPLKPELCNPRSFITPWQPWAKWSMTETRKKWSQGANLDAAHGETPAHGTHIPSAQSCAAAQGAAKVTGRRGCYLK